MKNMLQNQEFRFNEVLFEHRNKEYGAYALRNESGRILTKALFIGASLLAAVSVTPVIMNAFKSNSASTIICTYSGPIVLENVDTPEIPVQVTPIQPTKPEVKTYDSSVPTPSSHAPDINTKKIPDNAVAGLSNNFKADPAPQNTYVPNAPTIGTGPVSIAPPPKAETKTDDPGGIPAVVDVEASFPGGVNAFRNKVMNNFDGSGMETDEVMKTTVTFIVEKDGSISGLKAEGKNADFNNEALRTIRLIKGKWIPAKVKNQPVRSYFRFPITMKLDN